MKTAEEQIHDMALMIDGAKTYPEKIRLAEGLVAAQLYLNDALLARIVALEKNGSNAKKGNADHG